MNKSLKAIIIVAALVILFGATWHLAFTQEIDGRYYPQTGHFIRNEFLDFYLTETNAELLFGYPITEAFIQPNTNVLVQYFEKTRLEFHPDNPRGQQIQITPLGTFMYEPKEPFPFQANDNQCQTIDNYSVCLAFLEFYKTNGSENLFGKPISGMELDGDRIIQNFENARLEYFPEGSSIGQYIKVINLGRQYFYANGEDPSLLPPITNNSISNEIIELSVYAFPFKAVSTTSDIEPIYVIVLDQSLQPVSNVSVSVALRSPGGEPHNYLFDPTNEKGITVLDIPLGGLNLPSGIVLVEVNAIHSDIQNQTITSFRISR